MCFFSCRKVERKTVFYLNISNFILYLIFKTFICNWWTYMFLFYSIINGWRQIKYMTCTFTFWFVLRFNPSFESMHKSFGNEFRQNYVGFVATQKSNYCFSSYFFTSVLFFGGGGGEGMGRFFSKGNLSLEGCGYL